MIQGLIWLKHASFVYNNSSSTPPGAGKRVYFDPWQLDETEQADFILISHGHYDHLDPASIKKIRAARTVVVAPADCVAQIGGDVKTLVPGEELAFSGISVRAVRAYNIGKMFHVRENGWVGYVVTIDGVKVYHAGDTDLIPEMEGLQCDVALLPVGGTYTMDAEEAAEAATVIKPKIAAVPMHYGYIVGSRKDGDAFKKFAKVSAEIMRPKYPFEKKPQ